MRARVFTDAFIANAESIKNQFPSLKALAAHLGVDAGELSKNLRAKGFVSDTRKGRVSPRRINVDAAQLVAMNMQGESVSEIARKIGVSTGVVRRAIIGENVEPRKDFFDFTVSDVARMFSNGYSILAIANHFHASRGAIVSRLNRAGIHTRNGTEANRIRFSRASANELRLLTANARQARMRNLNELSESSLASIGAGESEIADALAAGGVPFRRQSALGPYSLDFRVRDVAVEIKYSRTVSGCASDRPERTKYILDAKLGLLYITHSGIQYLAPCLPYVVAEIDRLSRDPSFIGQERVIRCRAYNGVSRFKGNNVAPIVITPNFMATIHKID